MLCVNKTSKYVHLTDLPALMTDIDKPGEGAVDIPVGESFNAEILRVVDKYAFIKSPDGYETYIGVSLLCFCIIVYSMLYISPHISLLFLTTCVFCSYIHNLRVVFSF